MSELSNYIWSFVTFWNAFLAIAFLPLATMLILLPFHHYFSKNARKQIGYFGILGTIAILLLGGYWGERTLDAIVFYLKQKRQMSSAPKSGMNLEPFDFTPLFYFILLIIILLVSGDLAERYIEFKRRGSRHDSDVNS